jgi:hypothetical protein
MDEFRKEGLSAANTWGLHPIYNPHMTIVNIMKKEDEWMGKEWASMLDPSVVFGTETVHGGFWGRGIEVCGFLAVQLVKGDDLVHEVEVESC